MAQPYDYTQGFVNPAQGFLQGLQIGAQMRQQRAQTQEAEAKRARQAAMQAALADWRTDRNPQKTADLLVQFPEMADAIKASQGVLDDAAKQQNAAFAVDVFGLLKNGMTDRAIPLLEERVTALKNTKGKEAEARSAEYMLEQVRKNPEIALDTASLYLATVAPDVYNKVVQSSELTGFQKNLKAAGIDPSSPEGQQLAGQFVENQVDPLVEIETPSGGKFVGPRSEYFRRYGGGSPAPRALPSPTTPEQVAALPPGTQFRAPDGSVRTTPMRNTMSNTPAPDTGPSGMPQMITRAQYDAIVAAKGKEATDAMIARNNIKVAR